jgi:hypothetical protein
LLQAFVREGVPAERAADLVEAARRALAAIPRGNPRQPAAWPGYAVLLPHAFALDLVQSPDARCHQLLLDLVHNLVVTGDAATARDLATAAYAAWRVTFGPDAESTLGAAAHLAQALYRLRDYQAAVALDAEVLRGRTALAGPDDPETLAAAHNLALEQWAAGGSAAPHAIQALEKVVDRRRQVLGADHPDTLRSIHNLALVRRASGDVLGALELDQDAHRRLRDALGEDHPDTLSSAYALALDLQALGRKQTAGEVEKQTYQRRREVLGADHPDTLRSAHLLAVGLIAAGQVKHAQYLAEDTYRRRSQVLGVHHIETQRSRQLLARSRIDESAQETPPFDGGGR